MAGWWRDVRYGLRMLARNKGFAAVAVLALALGVGPNVAIFSIIWATYFAPLPYPDANRVILVWNHHKGERAPTHADDYAQYAAQSHSFDRLDFQAWTTLHLTNPDHSEEDIGGVPISPGFITKTLGLRMALGRDFLPDEGLPGNDHYVIINNVMWRNRYHSDVHIIGKPTLLDDQPYTVVGVMEAGHPDADGESFSVPIVLKPGVHTTYIGAVFGRLKPGVTVAQAQAEITLIRRRIDAEHHSKVPSSDWTMTVELLRNDWLDRTLARNLWLLLAAVAFVLLIACANVANLLLARGSSRQQEIALRSALGATRRQVFAQLLTESLTLALFGGLVGIGIGWAVMKASLTLLPTLVDQVEAPVQFSLPVLSFALGVTLFCGVLFGCVPAWKAGCQHLSETLKQGSRSTTTRGRFRLQGTLVASEFALALTLLAGAGMALHSFWNLSQIDLGMSTDHVLSVKLERRALGHSGNNQSKALPPSAAEVLSRDRLLLERIQAVPGVAEATLTTNPPLNGHDVFPFTIDGRPSDPFAPAVADLKVVTPDYLRTLRIQLTRGRFLNESDTMSSPLAIVVNESFVRRYLADSDPIGRRLTISAPGGHWSGPAGPFDVVGVFHDVVNDGHLIGGVQPEMIASLWQMPRSWVTVLAHTTIDSGAVIGGIRKAVAETMPDYVVDQFETMSHKVASQLTSDRFGMALLTALACVALFLAALGVYGVMSFMVTQRKHEIGIRMALGAERQQVVAMIVAAGLRMAIPGVLLGLPGIWLVARVMHSMLFGVAAADYRTFAFVAILLLGVSVLSSWLPARRSSRVDPMLALREE